MAKIIKKKEFKKAVEDIFGGVDGGEGKFLECHSKGLEQNFTSHYYWLHTKAIQ